MLSRPTGAQVGEHPAVGLMVAIIAGAVYACATHLGQAAVTGNDSGSKDNDRRPAAMASATTVERMRVVSLGKRDMCFSFLEREVDMLTL